MLNREEILDLIRKKNLIEDYIDLDAQLTPNGFDLSIASVFAFKEEGCLDFSNNERKIPSSEELIPEKNNPSDKYGWWNLKPGTYKIKTNERVNLPNDLTALAFSRTSLLRMGTFTQHGVWDAGFKGKAEFILKVDNPYGLKIKQNARVAQLVFLPINHTLKGYEGVYSNLK